MLKLNNLSKAGKTRKRVGRGGARGQTSGRGFGGQKARTGAGVREFFEGGQMPLIRRLPKRGFNNAVFRKEYKVINLDEVAKRFNANETVTLDMFISKGLLKNSKCVVKILADGIKDFDKKLTIYAHAFSKGAREAIEKMGGSAMLIEEK